MQQIPLAKIESLENEVKTLKTLGQKPSRKRGQKSKPSNIEGILKGIKFTEEDFKEAEFQFNYNHIIYQKHSK